MLKSKQKATDAKPAAGKTATPVTNAPVKPASTKETAAATKAAKGKATATVAATPTREVQPVGKSANKADKAASAGKNINASTAPMKSSNVAQNANANKASAKSANTKTKTKSKTKKTVPVGDITHRSLGVTFLLRLVLGLAPEKRAQCELIREILTHERKNRLVLTPSSKGLQAAYDATVNWAKVPENEIRVMARQAQSDKFQEAMQQLKGEYLYDAVRKQLILAAGPSVWEAIKDKHSLQEKNIPSRSGPATKAVKPQKEKQVVKKATPQVQSVKKSVPEKATPPPAPVNAKAAAAPIKKEAVPKGKAQPAKAEAPVKNAAPVKGAAPVKNAAPTKNATPAKNASAATAQTQQGAIVGGARGGRATVGKK